MCHHHERGRFGAGCDSPQFEKFRRKAGHFASLFQSPPVNVRETEDRFEILVYAPGGKRSYFSLYINGEVLTITGKPEESDLQPDNHWRRQEYQFPAFERNFQLNERVDTEAISAQYADGILLVTLPKLAGREGFDAREIPVV